MIIFGFELPSGAPRGPVVLVVILEMENIERMKKADPFDMKLADLAGTLTERKLWEVDLVIACEDDHAELLRFQKNQDIPGLMRWLERGRKILPGDYGPIRRLREAKAQ